MKLFFLNIPKILLEHNTIDKAQLLVETLPYITLQKKLKNSKKQ